MNDTVAIILPTYNGEKYIESQIKSIEKQTYKKWVIYIRDDGSNDLTIYKLKKIKKRLGKKICLINDNKGNLGVNENIFLIMEYVSEEYIMFSDQDDYWDRDKIKKNLYILKKKEKLDAKPILVYSDSRIVDQNLNLIAKSFLKKSNLDIRKNDLCNLLQTNVVQGCTMIINRKLKNKLKKINWKLVTSFIYDQYIAVVASIFGKVYYINQPLLSYRQHIDNSIGYENVNIIKWHKYLFSKQKGENNNFEYYNYLYINYELIDVIERNYELPKESFEKVNWIKDGANNIKKMIANGYYRTYDLKTILYKIVLKRRDDYLHKDIFKFKRYYNVLNIWKRKNTNIADYLRNHGYTNIAVYGIGELGITLLSDLEKHSLKINCLIDKNSKKCSFGSVVQLEKIPSDIDCIIVTAIFAFPEIRREIKKYSDAEVISLDDIVCEM